MHLAHDNPLGAVHNKRTVWRHQRHVAHKDVLLFDVFDRFGTCIFVNFKHDQAQRHFQWRAVCHVTLLTLFNVILRLFQLVVDELKDRGFVKVFDRENRLEDAFDAFAVERLKLVT